MNVTRFMILFCMVLAGCEARSPEGGEGASTPGSRATPDPTTTSKGPVLAWVNDAPVYDAEVDFFLESRMNLLPFQTRDEEMRGKVLESLIASRAMAQVAERELTERERQELTMETAFFREELLAKRYLEKNAQPKPVSREMVREYYDTHPEEFGARTLKEIEWLSSVKDLDAKEREALLPSFQSLDSVSDWERVAANTNHDAVRVEYKRGFFSSELLDPRLGTVVASTVVDSASGVHMIGGRLHRIRVLVEREQPARSLGTVSSEIRKRLAPLAMRESVRKASDSATAEIEIRYPQTANIE